MSANTSHQEAQLILATEKGDLPAIQHYISSGLSPNTMNSFNENLLFLACKHGHGDIANFLLNNHANPFQLNSGNQNIFAAACLGGHLEMVKWILALSNQPEYASLKNPKFFLYGFYPKNFKVFEYFVRQGFFTENDLEKLPLIKYGNSPQLISLLELIFNHFPTLSLDSLSKLFSKLIISDADGNQLAAMEYMINQHPSIKTRFNSYFAQLLDAIVRPSIDTNPEEIIETHSQTLNNIFFCNDHYISPTLEFLLAHGLERSILNIESQSLLHYAATKQVDEYENVFHIRTLLDLDYPIDILNSKGQTPLHCAIQEGFQMHAAYLIYRGANVNAVDNKGLSPLNYAHQFCTLGFDPQYEENIEYRQQLIQILQDFGATTCSRL